MILKKTKSRKHNATLVEELRKRRRTVTEVGPSPYWRKVRLANRGPGRLRGWMLTFLPELFYMPFSPDQEIVIGKLDNIIHHGGLFSQAMPRGGGKSTLVKAAGLYALLEGYRSFIVPITADAASATAFIQFFQIALTSNEKITKAYTPVTGYWQVHDDGTRTATGYLAHGEGISMRYKSQLRADGKSSGTIWSQNKIVLPSTMASTNRQNLVYCSGGIITGKGLTGGFRGLHHNRQDGTTIRPDFVMLDDPQTRESAESDVQTATREKIICGDVLGLAGPNTRITAAMTCTVVRQNDLAERFLDRERNPQWQGERMSLVYNWPDSHNTLWRDYREIYRTAKRNGSTESCPPEATQFYADNREAMDAGSRVAWPARFRDGELSALQYAQNQLIDMGQEAFDSEMQNSPPKSRTASYEITEQLVSSRLSGLSRFDLSGTHFCCLMIDVNRSGLHWTAMGSATEFAGRVVNYGRYLPQGKRQVWEDDASDGIGVKQAIYAALKGLCDEIQSATWLRDGAATRPNLVLIDCGFEMDVVFKFCAWADLHYPFSVAASRGRSGREYRLPPPAKVIGRAGDGWHITRFGDRGKVLVHNSDRWRMGCQKAFLLPAGAPGSICLFGAATDHRFFAGQICAETLTDHVISDKGEEYFSWIRKSGVANDLLDSTVGAMAGLYALGVGDAGIAGPVRSAAKRQKTRVRSQVI